MARREMAVEPAAGHAATPAAGSDAVGISASLAALLRCIECGEQLTLAAVCDRPAYPELGPDGYFQCRGCGQRYPLIAGTVRMLPPALRSRLWSDYPRASEVLSAAGIKPLANGGSGDSDLKQRTADSFAYEWHRFGGLRDEWRKNFLDYMQPHAAASFEGRLVLDVGTGSGRHSFQAAALGARVVAIDVGRSIDVARRNLPTEVLTVQADAESLPFAAATFDYVMSLGVLHHLPDPQRAVARIAPLARPGGHLHIYIYWVPERLWHARILRGVQIARRVTVKLPHRVLHALCIPLAGLLAVGVVWPYRFARRIPQLRSVADAFPLKTYADYPFAVLVNDQFDRFSAPLEHRYTRTEARALLEAVGLEDVHVVSNSGWVCDGRIAEVR